MTKTNKKAYAVIIIDLLLFSLVACEKSQNESTTSEKDTTSETTTEATLNTISTTTDSTEETTSDIATEINMDFGEWTISQQFYKDKYTITDVINDIILYYNCDSLNKQNKIVNVYNIMEETNYIINLDLEYYNIYHSDNDYLYGYHREYKEGDINHYKDDIYIFKFIKYNYIDNKFKTYSADLSEIAHELGFIEYYNGFTYISGEGPLHRGIVKIDENSNITYFPDIMFDYPNHNLFIYNDKLYLHPSEYKSNGNKNYYALYEITEDDNYSELKNGMDILKKYDNCPMYLKNIDVEEYSLELDYIFVNSFENYNLNSSFTINYDSENNNIFIKDEENKTTNTFITNLFNPKIYGVKQSENKYYFIICDCYLEKDKEWYVITIEKKKI